MLRGQWTVFRKGAGATYFIMPQAHPRCQFIRDGKNVPQGIYFEFVERLVDRCLEQCFELVDPILDLVFCFGTVRMRL